MEKLAQRPSGMLVKVPEITMYFWIIKVLATTVGETFADFLNTNLGLGLSGTSVATFIALAIVLFFQFKGKGYKPPVYWLAIVLISIAGTLVTDNLTDVVGVSLITSSVFFSIALALVFTTWYLKEKIDLQTLAYSGGSVLTGLLLKKLHRNTITINKRHYLQYIPLK